MSDNKNKSTKETAQEWVDCIERLLKKEREHNAFLTEMRPKVSIVMNIDKMIETSNMWIKHIEYRLGQYKDNLAKEE